MKKKCFVFLAVTLFFCFSTTIVYTSANNVQTTRQKQSLSNEDSDWTLERTQLARESVREMFYHGYNNYMSIAFPHDELKPLSGTWTDSFIELGNLDLLHLDTNGTYRGVALTLIDSLSTLVILGDKTEFKKAISWLIDNLNFDVDARVNVFEADIRILGGLLSAHLLATESKLDLIDDYNDELLFLARDFGERLLKAFHQSPTGLPYAWINLKYGLMENEITEQCTAGIGTLLLEFDLLSYLTRDLRFHNAMLRAIRVLWSQRSNSTGLLGNSLDIVSLKWINENSGIGAGIDSFYETLLKTYLILGNFEYWSIFIESYASVLTYIKNGPWYPEADMKTGTTTHLQFNSLQAFWPGLQVMIGDIELAQETHRAFYSVWERYKLLPERFLLSTHTIHPTERYYPLRPELAESTYYLYRATRDPFYLDVGWDLYSSINNVTRTEFGFASVKDVSTFELEDRMCSFFLAETCKYLYLLFDESNFLHSGNYLFSTEGHIFPIFLHPKDFYQTPLSANAKSKKKHLQCPVVKEKKKYNMCHVEDKFPNHRCTKNTDCGIDHDCRPRKCSQHSYCFTPNSKIHR